MTGIIKKVEEIFTDDIIKKHKFVPITFAIKNIHFPDSLDSLEESRRRLKYEEFFLFETAMALRKRSIKEVDGNKFKIGANVENHIYKLFPFKLTNSQKEVIGEIHEDMCSVRPMNRLLQGDVGSGKTAVAVYVTFCCHCQWFSNSLYGSYRNPCRTALSYAGSHALASRGKNTAPHRGR